MHTVVLSMVATLMPALLIVAAPSALAAEPDHVNVSFDGCKNSGATLPNGNGDFVCPNADYASGNLGAGWDELDLVPFRLYASTGNAAPASQTYTIAIMVDGSKNGIPGYDVLSAPVLNTSLSSASCTAATSGAQSTVGTTTVSLYRLVTITQVAPSTCVYDYYARLAIGAHSYPGSSLHANLANENLSTAGIGAADTSIPVGDIAPQSINKDMTATQNSDHTWNVIKSPTPASLTFANTCDPNGSRQATVAITVSWTKSAANPSGPITIITHVYATNPASRALTINVSDTIYSGVNPLDTTSSGSITMPANTANILVLTHQTTVGAENSNLNDIATATYTDPVTSVSIPGTTTATASASVQPSGVTLNNSATITDVESISGGFSYSVDSFTGASGAFDGGYLTGTPTTSAVSWTSASQTSAGSVTLNKTVYASDAQVSSGGKLSDTATLTGSNGFSTGATLDVGLTANASTNLSVSKTTSLDIATQQTFNFALFDATTNLATGDTTTVTIPALGNGPVTSAAITGLSPTGSYYFHEDANAPYAAQNTSTVTFALVTGDISTCSATVSVANNAAPATAQVSKITAPLSSGYWTFTLTGPNGLTETLNNVVANAAGYAAFASSLDADGGTYTITETQQTGYDNTTIIGDVNSAANRVTTNTTTRTCSFTLNLATDSGGLFSCTFTNRQRGHVRVVKTVGGAALTGSQAWTFQLRSGASTTAAGTILEALTANAGNGGTINFATNLVPNDPYQLCEQLMPGWMTSLGPPIFSVYNPSGDNSVVCTDFSVTAGQLKIFNIDNTAPPGGRALTIGFWKNWASCAASNGKQKPVLDQALLAAALAGAPITLGLLVLDPNVLGAATACRYAVAILNKSTVTSGKKMASDPLFNMAAQLLAADLNVAAGAGTCASAVSAITAAHALLTSYNFDGNSYAPKLSKADATQANTLATTLDRYNNNLLC